MFVKLGFTFPSLCLRQNLLLINHLHDDTIILQRMGLVFCLVFKERAMRLSSVQVRVCCIT
jgi:hypothetical protein